MPTCLLGEQQSYLRAGQVLTELAVSGSDMRESAIAFASSVVDGCIGAHG
jgi:hypothetical protein